MRLHRIERLMGLAPRRISLGKKPCFGSISCPQTRAIGKSMHPTRIGTSELIEFGNKFRVRRRPKEVEGATPLR